MTLKKFLRNASHSTFIVSRSDVLDQKDISRAIASCGWDISRLVTLEKDPCVSLLEQAWKGDIILCRPPRFQRHRVAILHKVTACIFIEPAGDKRLSYPWTFIENYKHLTYHYHPELFPRTL